MNVCVCVCQPKLAKAQDGANVQSRFGTMGSLQINAPLPARKGHELCPAERHKGFGNHLVVHAFIWYATCTRFVMTAAAIRCSSASAH